MDILSKLYTGSSQQAINDIISHRNKHNHCVVHFLYFANAIKNNLLSVTLSETRSIEDKKENNSHTSPSSQLSKGQGYYDSLLASDFLLPDGIALQIFYAIAVSIGRVSSQRKRLANCNGTDLTLPLLQALPKDAQIHLYGTTTSVIKKAADFLRMQDITPASIADGYSDFDWSQMDIKQKNILLIGRGTPLQELRVAQNMQQIKKYKILVLSVGGLFDFWGGEEKRTPAVFRGWAERLRRLCVNPRKNAIKVRYSLSLPYTIVHHLLLKRYKS